MQINSGKYRGFTIVELLIVVVVIAILAAITLVAFNGITNNAVESSLKSDLRNTAAKLGMVHTEQDSYPASLGASKVESSGNTLAYAATANGYCLQATSSKSAKTFRITQEGTIEEGECGAGSGALAPSRLALGGNHTCALASNNQAYCWGRGDSGQLGSGTTDSQSSPVAASRGVIPSGVALTSIITGSDYSCALTGNSRVYCWGGGAYGQLGSGTTNSQPSPVAVLQGAIPSGVALTNITTSRVHSCALASNSQAYCWGSGTYGQLGDGTLASNQPSPVAVLQGAIPSGVTLTSIAAGGMHVCALASNNQAYCWGRGDSGQLGSGTATTRQPSPVAVLQGAIPSGVTLTSIAAGSNHSCALASNNQAYCWGSGISGQLGNGATSGQPTPVAVLQGAIPSGVTLTSIATGSDHSCALASNNQVYCWGSGSSGQLGNGATNPSRSSPVAVLQGAIPTGVTLTSIAAGSGHSCALASNSQVYCWGYGAFGQLGNGAIANQSSPVAVLQGDIPSGVTF